MPHQTPTHLFTLLGMVAWGDIGPITIYRNQRGRMVWFAKTWPKKPPSPDQQAQRDRLTAAAADWQALSPGQQAQWHLAARRASLTMHGYDLFQHWKLSKDTSAIATLERQTGTNLLP